MFRTRPAIIQVLEQRSLVGKRNFLQEGGLTFECGDIDPILDLMGMLVQARTLQVTQYTKDLNKSTILIRQ